MLVFVRIYNQKGIRKNLLKIFMLLHTIATPTDLRKIAATDLPQLCEELRSFIISQVAVHGGHLGASLGVVELTVALHYIFDTPNDKLVWDVGHQAYGHKILTGRRAVFHTNRKLNGISGFPKRSESIYDTFGVGHSSTSISAALGMAMAAQLNHKTTQQHIAVIGDGGLTAGLAFEALNHGLGIENPPNLLIIINDNGMSIDKNVGFLNKYSQEIITQLIDYQTKNYNKNNKNIVSFLGTVDGHDLTQLLALLQEQKNKQGIRILHCKTVKGKGFLQAELDQITWHAPSLFDKITGEIYKKEKITPQPPKYQDVFGHTLVELAQKNDKIVGITPAMLSGSSMRFLMDKYPERTFDVGIAEQHAVTFSAGLATEGYLPFCNIYSTFLQRGYDQLIHDVCLQNLKVVFCLDRAGLVGADGATHHGAYDIAFLRCIPNLVVAAPMHEIDLRNMLYTAQLTENQTSIAIRYPRGQGVMTEWQKTFEQIQIGKSHCVQKGEKVAVLSFGHLGNKVVEACKLLATKNIYPHHQNMRFVKPLDTKCIDELLHNNNIHTFITVEDGCKLGGFGSAILEYIAQKYSEMNNTEMKPKKIIVLGLPDQFIEQGEPHELYDLCGLSTKQLTQVIETAYFTS
jgi:1-deoxy-D-xylulose-5-phosphate synthase